MRPIDLDAIYRQFGDQRFTLRDYMGGAPRYPYQDKEVAAFLDAGVRDGALEVVPGPRGGRGYRMASKQIASAKRRETAAAQRQARSDARWEEHIRRDTEYRIKEAIKPLE